MKRRHATARPWCVLCGVLALVMASLVVSPAALASVSTGDGGWVWQRGLEAGTAYSHVMFASSSSGWTVGSGGRILHTFDGGDTWYRQRSGTDQDLTAVDVPDGQSGWAVGAAGTILRTTDGGDTWVAQEAPSTDRFFDVGAVSAQEAWALGGSAARLLHTTDGGATWQTSPVLDGYTQWGGIVFDADRQHGWIAVSTAATLGLVLRTSDGGQTWEQSHTGCGYTISALASNGSGTVIAGDQGGYLARSTDWGATWQAYPAIYLGIAAMAFASPDTAWATTSRGGLMRTVDGGQTWQYVTSKPWRLASVAFAGETNGWAVGDNGSMIRTDQTGQHWQTVKAEASEQLWDVAFTDAATGWAIGFESTSLRTTDGGESWAAASPRRPEKFESVTVVGSRAWAVGTGGSIFATGDGGAHWNAQDSGSSDELGVVSFSDLDHGWAAGTSGTILRTSDGGSTWEPCESGAFSTVTDVSVVDDQTVWFVAGGTAVMTADGGASFRSVTLPGSWSSLIDFVDAEHGWVADGQGRLYRTSDGGVSWDDYSFGSPRIFFMAIDFSSPLDGWAFGNGCGWTTTDGGQTWVQDTQPWDSQLAQPVQTVDFDGAAGLAVGYNGTVLTTTDRGGSWQARAAGTSAALSAAAADSDGTAYAVGDNGLIIRSTDGGATWAAQMMGLPRNLSALSAFDASTAYVAGQYGFSRTTDAGGIWSFLPQGYGGVVMDFSDPLSGWMAGYSGELAHTTDGGLSWQPQSLGTGTEFIFDIDFIDSQTGWVLGLYHRIYTTTDAGATWTPIDARSLDANAIHFLSKDVGWAVGSYSISQTTDGGATWQQKADSPALPPTTGRAALSAVDFADAQHGWAVGEGGAIMATTDGGANWSPQDSGTSQWLRGVAATGPQSVWVAGEGGAILHTTNGGFPAPDDAPPVTTLDVTPQAGPAGAVAGRSAAAPQWFTTVPDLALDARDATGIQVTAWSVDPPSTRSGLIPWRRGASPVLTGQGLHQICYRSVDDFGNAEQVRSKWVGLDQTAPVPQASRPASVKRGHKVTLRYEIADVPGSPQSVTLVIRSTRGKVMRKVVLRQRRSNVSLSYSFVCAFKQGSYRFSVSSVDPVGYRSARPASNGLRVR
jgi:photosystem II stability/assembly factor-like uncharacterized protein